MDIQLRATLAHMFRSLRYQSFRRYFVGHSISVCGVWMQNVAQSWLVFRLSGSEFMLGLTSFCALSPMLLLGLTGGRLADRYSPHRLLWISQTLALLQAIGLAALTFGGHIRLWHVLSLAFLLGLAQAMQVPARHAYIAKLVPRDELPNAIALNSFAFNSARFVGPALAGLLVAVSHEGLVFFINGLAILIYLGLLTSMKLPGSERVNAHVSLGEGLHHAWHSPRIRAGLVIAGVISLFGTPYLVLMPVFASSVFGGGPETLGGLMSAAGAGSLIGALSLALRHKQEGLDTSIAWAAMLAGLTLFIFSRTDVLVVALASLFVAGFSLTRAIVSTNTMIQVQVPDGLRGRVMSLFTVTFLGLSPIGSLAAGALAESVGAASTVLIYSLLFAVGSGVFAYFIHGEGL